MKKLLLILLIFSGFVQAQYKGVGLRFASDFNHFYRSKENILSDGWFSNAIIGTYFAAFSKHGGIELGANFLYKPQKNSFSFPLIQRDLSKDSSLNVGLSAFEGEFKFGPRILRLIYPQSGYVFGFRTKSIGFSEASAGPQTVKKFYMSIPVGCSVYLPTAFGTTGFGIHYDIGVTNVLNNNNSKSEAQNGRLNSIRFQITVMFGETELK